jgi:thiamine kinase-like enzyme
MLVDELISRIPELSEGLLRYERLSGGLCNQTYKVITKSRPLVLRINSSQNEYLNLTRGSEVEVMKFAHREGFAPDVVVSHDPEQFVVTEFVEGRTLERADLNDDRIKGMIMDQLKRIHRMKVDGRICSPYTLIFGYLKGADQFQVRHPEGLTRILNRVEQIAHERSYDKQFNGKFCHNDSFLCNMIYAGEELKVIDWELSGIGDVLFELTLIPISNQFGEAEDREWLSSYIGYDDDDLFRAYQDMKFVSMVREVAWGMFFSGLTKDDPYHDFDYYKIAEHCIERIEQGIYYY